MACLTDMKRHVEREFSAVVAPPAGRVMALLRDSLGAPSSRLEEVTLEELPDGLAVEGGWWYRGEYHVIAERVQPAVARVVYRVRNVAPPATRWLVPLVVGKDEATVQEAAFTDLMNVIRAAAEPPPVGDSERPVAAEPQ